MILPRFSIRWVLGITVASTVFFLIAAQSGTHPWAAGVTVAVASVLLLIFIQACAFAGIWIMALLVDTIRGKAVPVPYTDPTMRLPSGPEPDPIGPRSQPAEADATDLAAPQLPGRPDALAGGSDQ